MGSNWFYNEQNTLEISSKYDDEQETVCPYCKTEKADFLDTMFLGCPHCYEVFSEDVARAIENYQGASEHVGKVPEKVLNKESIRLEIEKLEKLKAQAVIKEDYMLAEVYLQKIKSLKGEK